MHFQYQKGELSSINFIILNKRKEEFKSIHSDNFDIDINGLIAEEKIYLSSIEQLNDQRQMNYCLGTLSVYGIVTARSCCEVDELYIVDQEKFKEFPLDLNSVWIDHQICLINKTENVQKNVKKVDQTNDCSITVFDSDTSDFINIEIDKRNINCLKKNCYYTPNFNDNWTLLNGTAVICQHSTIYGIITTSLFKYLLIYLLF